jgi:nucleotide sugar dehydrogenase
VPSILHLRPTDVDTNVKRSKYSVAVVGCGHKGIFYANAFADAGFKVLCTDADASVLKKISKGKTPFGMVETEAKLRSHINSEKISVIAELKKAVSQSDVVVIAITAKLDEKKKNDCKGLESTCKQVGANLHEGALILYAGIAGLGFTEGTIKELLENTSGLKVGQNLGLAYSPILSTSDPITKSELKVAATENTSLEAATIILKTLTDNIKEISDIKTAEASILFTVAKKDVNIALTNELAVFCESVNIDYFKVLDTLEIDKPVFRPTIIEEENINETYLLLDCAENVNVKLRLPALARQINCGKTLRRCRVAVLGKVSRTSSIRAFIKIIEQKGAKVNLYDPTAKKESIDVGVLKTSLKEAVEGSDCIVVLSEHEQLNRLNLKKLKALMKTPSAVVDLVGKIDRGQIEKEGFIYFGLGRRIDKK